ncbi:MAG: CARDB domain-containing protein [Chitinophagaceae bacterium]
MQNNFGTYKKAVRLLVLLYLLCINTILAQTNISKVEYFFDTDPGFGNGINIPITPSTDIADQLYSIDLSNLSNGFHRFFLRTMDDSGKWSVTNYKPIFRASLGSTSNASIVKAEYFFDTDPGFGKATSINLSNNNNIADAIVAIDLSAVSVGFHSFFVRTQDENGTWSITNTQSIFKTGSNTALPNIVETEYFFDTDPGFGKGTSITLSSATDLADQILAIDLSNVSVGFHSFFIRSKNENGNWSLTNTQSIFKTGANTTVPNLVSAEYFFDNDPGFNNANPIIFTPTTNLVDEVETIDLTNVSNGFHSFNFRTKDANGGWSLTNRQTFFKLGSSVLANISRVEYFIDTDPGFGNASVIPVTEALDINNQTYNFIKPNSLTEGSHTLYVRAMDANGSWSLTNNIQFYHTIKKAGSGYCLSLNGSNQYASIPHNQNLNCSNQITLEAWVYPTAFNTTYPSIVAKNNAGSAYELDLKNDGTIQFELFINGTQRALNGGGISLNQWTHVAATYNGSQMRIYQNGVLVATANYSGVIGNNTSPVTIGARSGGGALFAGKIDEVKIWNTALTQTQLRDKMCSKLALNDAIVGNLMSYLNCDEVAANYVYDLTDSLNHALLINSPAKVLSGAPIGDTSAYTYVTSGLPSKLLSLSNTDSINISLISGSYNNEAGLQIYAVNNKPSSNLGLGGIALNNDRYFGVFTANISNPNYTANYYYSANPFITGIIPNELGLFKREDNSVTTWVNSNANLNTSNNSLEVTGQSTEYILSNCAVAIVPTATITKTLPNVCDVTSVIFTASVINGGSNPQYQWKLNGNNVGANTYIYNNGALANGDSVWCLLTSNATCVNTPTVSSNKVVTIYPTITTENIDVFGCFTATYNGNTYSANTAFIDTIKTYQGCDSIYKNVSITVYTSAVTYDTVRVSGCNSVLYNNVTYTNSTAFTDTVKTIAGCDNIYRRIIITVYDITPTVQNNIVYGCGSIVFHSNNYTSNTLVKDTLKAVSGCDSIYMHSYITIINPVTHNVSLLGCGSYTYKSIAYNNSAFFIDTLHSISGCDSIYKNVTIIVIHPSTVNISLNGCNTVTYNAVNYTSSTTVNDTIKSSLGCDSIYNIVAINITTVNPVIQTIKYNGCNSYTYNAVTYSSSTTLHDTLHSYQGCDSVYRTINIGIHHQSVTTNATNINGCNNVIYNSNSYAASTVLRDTIKNIYGCDSIYNVVNINVTYVSPYTQAIDISGCDSALFNTIKYTSSTVLYDTLYSYQGCDSVYRTINITIQVKPNIGVTASVNPVCATNATILSANGGGNYTWSPSTALSSTSGASVTASPANTITYTVTSNQICVTTAQITVVTKALPNVDAGANQSILLGSSTTLTATGAASYVWNTGNTADTTATITVAPSSNTNYIVTGTAANGCTAQDLVSVAVNFSSLSVNTNNYNFGNVVVNTTANTNIIVTNNGTLAITLNSIIAPSPYSGNITSQTINVGSSVIIPISFTPTATLFYTRTLTISTSLGNFTITLQGRGVNAAPAWVLTPISNSFGNVRVGDSSTQSFTITNTGNIAINVASLVSNNNKFTATASSNSIAVGASTTLFVKYKPTSVATSNAVITVNSSINNLSALVANVSGSGYIENPPPTLIFANANPFNGSTGVNPTVGQAGDYTYRIVYKSGTGTPPQAGYPKVGIDANGDGDYIDANEGTFTMNKVNATSDWVNGEEYTYTTTLQIGNNYGYRFFANDALGNPANTVNINHNNGPVVSDQTLDLSIYASDISFSVAHPAVGQTFTVFATVHNNTPYSASGVNIKFYTDSVYYNQTILPFIGANSTAVVSMNFVYTSEGFYPIKVWVDSANNLGETNALNNYAIRPIIVGAFSIPGAILVSANGNAQNCPDGVVVSGYANYSGLNLAGTPPVLGALVTVYIDGVASGTTYTISGGYYSLFISKPCGSHTYSVEVTDFTLTGNSTTNNTSIACGVSCGSSGAGGNSGNYEPSFYSTSGTPCCLVNAATFNYAINIVNNGTATSYRDTIKVFSDSVLLYTYVIDSLQINQSVTYNNAITLTAGNHTLSYTHSYYNAANTRVVSNGSNLIYVETDLPDLFLTQFQQTSGTSFTIRNYNSTCTQAPTSKMYIYETDNNYSNAVLLDSVVSQAVAGGKCGNTSVLLSFNYTGWTPGYHYLTLKTDGGNTIAETNENNNNLNVVVYVPQPDLYVGFINVSSSDVHSGDVVNFNTSIKNQGSAATAFRVQFKVNDVNFGNKINIASLGANDSVVLNSNNYIIPVSNCPVKITVVADIEDDINELVERNNADSILFGSDIITSVPAYTLGSPQTPYTVFIGTSLSIATTIKNIGLRDVDTTKVRFKLGSTVIGADNIIHINSNGASAVAQFSHIFNTVGSYVIKVEPDYDEVYCETNEQNNDGYIYVNVIDAIADLRILSQHISPSNLNPIPGQNVTIVSSVQNIGNYASTPAMVRFWVNDIQLGNDVAINSILPGRDTTIAATVTYTSSLVGLKVIKVRADVNNEVVEIDTTNNAATRAIIVGGAPDFARSINQGITFNRNLFRVGKKITISNYIRNYGGDTGRATINFYYKTPTSKTLINSVAFRLNQHDSTKLSTAWIVAGASGKIITEIVNASPQEFNTFNNVDSVDFVADTTTPYVTVTPNLTSVCQGTAIIFTATSQNVIAPKYVWKVNGIYTNDTAAFIAKVLNAGDNVSFDLYDEEQFLKSSINILPIIRSKTYSSISVSRCPNQLPFIWGGDGYSIAGTYNKTYINVAGCDSIATLVLNVLQPTSSITRDSIFSGNSYSFNGNNYTQSGTYTASLTNSIGCDSTAILILLVKPVLNGAAISGILKSCDLNTVNRLYCAASYGVWSSSNTSVATISNNGTVTPLNSGSTNISYTYTIAGITYVSTAVYVVAPLVTPNSISGPASVCAGSSIVLTNTTSNGIWSSLQTSQVVVNPTTGAVVGKSAGFATINYTITNAAGCSAVVSKNIIINAIPAMPSIAYAPGTALTGSSSPFYGAPSGSFCVGKTFGLVGNPNTPAGVWSATGAASITNAGIVTISTVGLGTIKYSYSNAAGCSSSRTLSGNGYSCVARNITNELSTAENLIPLSFVLYPNPAKSFFNLKIDKLIGLGSVIVTDLFGKIIVKQPLSVGVNTINTSMFSKGIYFVSVITNDGKSTQKLVVE